MTTTDQQMLTISQQVRDLIEQMIASGQEPVADWLVNAVIGSWEKPRGRDASKWEISGYANVRNIVRQVVQRYRPAANDDDEQMSLFPGYEWLHRAYLIGRDGVQKIIPSENLTVDEAFNIISELMRNRTGLDMHIHEMQRFIDEVLIPRRARAS